MLARVFILALATSWSWQLQASHAHTGNNLHVYQQENKNVSNDISPMKYHPTIQCAALHTTALMNLTDDAKQKMPNKKTTRLHYI